MRVPIRWVGLVVFYWSTLLFRVAAAAQPMVALDVAGASYEGLPLSVTNQQAVILARDGALVTIDPSRASNFRKTADYFTPFSQSELRAQLMREYYPGFEVSGTGHFLVVHPSGQRDRWSTRFEELYRSFVRFFSVRGFSPSAPEFPFVAIVFPNRAEFAHNARRENVGMSEGLLGYYSPATNRITMYDVANGQREDPNWHINASTIIHEAAHQTAFNLGIHSRYTMPPRWLAEGLGTLFEAPGVYDSQRNVSRKDRINRGQLESFRRYLQRGRRASSLPELIQSDRPFFDRPEEAYAEAWALTFYLTETEPRKYVEYLKATANREKFREMRSPEILNEFTGVFGESWDMLDARLVRFIQEL